MKTISKTIKTTAQLSTDGLHRYALNIVWEESKPKLLVIMLVAGMSDGICMDSSTCHVLENAIRLGYGSVTICNLFSCVGDYHLREDDSEYYLENENVILTQAQEASTVVYCPGRGKAALKVFQEREHQLLYALQEVSMLCISDGMGQTQFHPLSPKVRQWTLVPFEKKASQKVNGTASSSAITSKRKHKSKAS